MTILLPTLAVAFAAFCVWLGVRIVNRREKWAIHLAAFVGSFFLAAAAIYALFVIWGLLASANA